DDCYPTHGVSPHTYPARPPLTPAGAAESDEDPGPWARPAHAHDPGGLPVRSLVVVLVCPLGPRYIGHAWPVVLVEPFGVLHSLLVDVQQKSLALCVQRQGAPRYGEQFVAHSQETATRQHRIGDASARNVQHDVLNRAKLLVRQVI